MCTNTLAHTLTHIYNTFFEDKDAPCLLPYYKDAYILVHIQKYVHAHVYKYLFMSLKCYTSTFISISAM